MPKILLSYRRSDSAGIAGRIFDRLVAHFGPDAIFMDVDNIPFGADFRDHIRESLLTSDVLLAIVGPRWLGPLPDGRSRIKDDNDPVRVEIETALRQGLPLIPILVDGAVMPSPADLPDALGKLSYLNAPSVDMGRDFHQHMDRVIRAIDGLLAARAAARAASAAAAQAKAAHDAATHDTATHDTAKSDTARLGPVERAVDPAPPVRAAPAPAETASAMPRVPSQAAARPAASGRWMWAAGGVAVVAAVAALIYLQWPRQPAPSAGTSTAAALPTTTSAPDTGPPAGATIKIGLGLSLSGQFSNDGATAALAQKIWQEDVNAGGGLLGRRVELVTYDDRSDPSAVPGIYTKLLDVDQVALIAGGYGTAQVRSAMPVAMGHNKVLIGLLAVDANSELGYPRYFAMSPTGPDPNPAWSRGFFNAAMAQNPKPRSWGVLAADYAYCKDVTSGARANAKSAGLSLLYDRTFPLRNLDFFTHIAALSAAKADIVFVCAAGADAINFIHQFTQKGLAPKMIGGVMVGLQATSDKVQLGDALNGWVLYDFWLPAPALEFAGTSDFVRKYQARAAAEGADPLGYYVAPWAYAQLQVLGQAVAATKSVDDAKLADYIRASTFKTVVGDVKFGAKGEWAEPRVLQVQFQNIKGNTIDQFRDTKSQVVVDPPAYKSGSMIYPFVDARK